MTGVSKKALGISIICLSAIGFLISLFFLIQIWRFRQPVINKLQSGLGLSSAILHTTDEGLVVIDQVVQDVYTSTSSLSEATDAIGKAMNSTGEFVDSVSTFVGEDLIRTITNTQTALNSAKVSAAMIDNFLTTLSSIPLLGVTYNPATPLNVALGNVSSSLDPVQKSLYDFQNNLDTTQTDLRLVSDQIMSLKQKITNINNSLIKTRTTIADYRKQVNSLISTVDHAKSALPNWINISAWLLTIVILWMVILQISILLQGISLLSKQLKNQAIQENKEKQVEYS